MRGGPLELLFEIPVYRISPEAFRAEKDDIVQKYAEGLRRQGMPSSREEGRRVANFYGLLWPWEYNEIVGWIELRADGNRIKGYLWWEPDRQRFQRGHRIRRLFESHKVIEALVLPRESSPEIFQQVLDDLDEAAKHPPLHRRYVDVEALARLGPHVDWRGVLGLGRS